MGVWENHGDVALRAVVSGHGGVGWGVDLVLSVTFSNMNDSVLRPLALPDSLGTRRRCCQMYSWFNEGALTPLEHHHTTPSKLPIWVQKATRWDASSKRLESHF